MKGSLRKFTKPIPSPLNMQEVIQSHSQFLSSIEEKKQELEHLCAEAEAIQKEANSSHVEFITKAQNKITYLNSLIEEVRVLQKGDKGDPGESVNYEEVVKGVLAKVPPPKNGDPGLPGKDAVVDYPRVIKSVLSLLPKPEKGEKGKDANEQTIAEKIVELFVLGKKKIHAKYIEGLKEMIEKEIAPVRHLGAMRGGGDTVAAGSGVTITNSNGVKTISATGGSLSVLAATGTVDDSNTTFTFPSAPTLIIVNGATYRNGFGCTISGTTGTLNSPVGTGGDIYGLG